MKTQMNAYRLKHLTVLHATGPVDLAASKAALTELVAGSGLETRNDVLLDLRDSECDMSTADVFELAEFMGLPIATPIPPKKIAVLLDAHQQGCSAFNQAHFREMCGDGGCPNMRTFEDYGNAKAWLSLH